MEGGKNQNQKQKQNQSHFVLVHGACHGAWCWYKVAARLRSEGHRVTALDMAAAGVNLKPLEELSCFSDYCQPLIEFMAALPPEETVILVGHSMGGICISLAMEKYPDKIALAVFVTAFMPGPDFPVLTEYRRQVDDYKDSQFSFGTAEDQNPASVIFGPNFMASHLYNLSPAEDLTLATMLVRPVGLFNEPDLPEELGLSEGHYGSVRRAYVVCDEDRILKRGYQEWMIENNAVDEVKIISGADHMAMFSKSEELCASLNNLADKYWS